MSRNTVAKYRAWAEVMGFLSSAELPEPGVIEAKLRETEEAPAEGPESSAEPYRTFIAEKRQQGVEIRALLCLLRERGYGGSYSSLKRFVRRLEPEKKEAHVRIEVKPGEEAQVDFGYAGLQHDPVTGRARKAWVFVMTLSFSRHQYVEIVFDQKVETWVDLHVRAFEWFGGVPRRIVLDNLKAGIVKAVLHDQEAQRSYRELAEHYDFLIAPCRPRTPRHKGKVESGVRYVSRNALAGREFRDVRAANEHLLRWVMDVAGVRDHGTTHEAPLLRFELERDALRQLPPSRYEVTIWSQGKVHNDCHVVVDYSFYSAPYRLVGKDVWIRTMPRRIEIFEGHERIATHPRATKRGTWTTSPDHLPPDKLLGLLPEPVALRAEAKRIGASTDELVDVLLGERPHDRLRSAGAILALARRFGAERLEAACRRALSFGEVRYHTVKQILKGGLDIEGAPIGGIETGPLPKTAIYARTAAELLPVVA